MKTIILTLAATFLSVASAQSQNFEKLFYKDLVKETDDVTITVDNAVSTPGEIKFKLKITNKTNDYLIYKPFESKFIIDGKETKASEKMKIIKPNESDFVTVNLKGSGYNKVKNYSFSIEGIYRVATDGKGITAPNFKLPASQNEFKAGAFTCNMTDLVKTSAKTSAKFKCTYSGDKVGVIHYTRPALKLPDGTEHANEKKPGMLESKAKEMLVMKGDEVNLNVEWEKMEGGRATDMQKIALEIIWNATFTEAPAVKIKTEVIDLEFDEAMTIAKNK
jgi:hypothetical protein